MDYVDGSGSLFRQVDIPTGRYSDRSIFRQTVRYSDRSLFRQVDSPTNMSLFRQFDSSTNRSIFLVNSFRAASFFDMYYSFEACIYLFAIIIYIKECTQKKEIKMAKLTCERSIKPFKKKTFVLAGNGLLQINEIVSS